MYRWLQALAGGLVLLAWSPISPAAGLEVGFGRPQSPLLLQPVHPRIVNGVSADSGHPFPAVGLLAGPGLASCSAVLIGCRTALTAAHCVETAPRPNPYVLFFQHAGFFLLQDVAMHPEYTPGLAGSPHDLAILKLARPVSGIPPARLNDRRRPPPGSPGVIVGFGGTATTRQPDHGRGLKRWGQIETVSCSGFPAPTDDALHVCWLYTLPPAPPGRSSTLARGDSGGPLLIDLGGGPMLAGIHSATETGADFVQSLVADVYVDRRWIRARAQDLGSGLCGSTAQVGGPGVVLFSAQSTVGDAAESREVWSFEVPAGTEVLRVTLNGELGEQNADLYVREGAPPSLEPPLYDCAETEIQTIGACEISAPRPATWFALVDSEFGNNPYQLTASLFGPPTSPCPEREDVLCLAGGRFMAWARWTTSNGDSGFATTLPIDASHDSGLFWFFQRSNIELLLKVLDACASPFESFWVFYAATTDVELALTVFDTHSGAVRWYFNPVKVPANPVQDTLAFSTCP